MLATLTHRRFSDPGWIFERKLDGERCLAFRDGDDVHLVSRTHHSLNGGYPELVEVVAAQAVPRFVVDGEIVAFKGNRTSFTRLQPRMHIDEPAKSRRSGIAVYYYLFDLLALEGEDLRRLPLRERKGLLEDAIDFQDPLRLTTHRYGEGEAFYEDACLRGWEGLIAKRSASQYRGGRSRDWLKFKCMLRQEFVVAGFTDPGGTRVHFGALLLGYYEGNALRYAGKVGTGFDERTLVDLHAKLRSLEIDEPLFAGGELLRDGVHWVRPELVVEVGFTEWTGESRLRHPRYLGLRIDRQAAGVVRERTSDTRS